MQISDRYSSALTFAFEVHRGQLRKSTSIPYVAHLLTVSATVMEFGGSEDQCIAALLHDSLEDQGGMEIEKQIEKEFGVHVLGLVLECSDTIVRPKPPWRERKEKFVKSLTEVSVDALLIVAADSLHNAKSIERDFALVRNDLWKRFRGGKEGTLWYYKNVCRALKSRLNSQIVNELSQQVSQMLVIAGEA